MLIPNYNVIQIVIKNANFEKIFTYLIEKMYQIKKYKNLNCINEQECLICLQLANEISINTMRTRRVVQLRRRLQL